MSGAATGLTKTGAGVAMWSNSQTVLPDGNASLTSFRHAVSWSMRPWESTHRRRELGLGTDSQDRMDQNGSLAAAGEDLVNGLSVVRGPSDRHIVVRRSTAANFSLTSIWHAVSWSMRSWESVHRRRRLGLGADSQGRMDQTVSLAAVDVELVNAGYSLARI